MTAQLDPSGSDPARVEAFLSGALGRIRRITIILAAATSVGAFLLFGWHSGLGAVIGSLVGFLNLVWLHHGAAIMIDRMLAPAGKAPSKSRLVLSFLGRYFFVLAIAYAILRGFPRMFLGFTVSLFLPIAAAIFEGIYEAFVNIKIDETSDGTSLH